MSSMRKQALVIALACFLVLLAITPTISAANAAEAKAAATVAAISPQKDWKDVVYPQAGCRCCYFIRNQYGLLQCGYVCCVDGCC
ncbi:hypothetical protein LINPERHAP1_LOCUS5117 [Linum perenne]